MINRVDKKGSITYEKIRNSLVLEWNESHALKMKANVDYFARKMNRANGGTRSHLLFKIGFGANICYHPLGGCVLVQSTDLYGKLKEHDNLYLIDGSLIPGIGDNPFMTITVIAEYCIENLIKRREFD